jgi:hypothetical protein
MKQNHRLQHQGLASIYCALLVTCSTNAGAALTMHVDTTAKTLVMSGSGITNTGQNGYWIFSAPAEYGGNASNPTIDISSLVDLSGAAWGPGWGKISYGAGGGADAVMFGGNLDGASGPVTMTPTGATVSYASADADLISRIEANLETTWVSAFDSSGTEGLFVTAGPIPEPGSTVLFASGSLALGVWRRRRK